MDASLTGKQRAWVMFDGIVAGAAPGGEHTNPWTRDSDGHLQYQPDIEVLESLLSIPLHLGLQSQSGVPALALDVWLSYELRRAGFHPDATWPRATHPRIIPMPVVNLLEMLPKRERDALEQRLETKAAVKGVTSASASILGKNYFKQVDVIMTDWDTGPELLISTKRMDKSYGKNAANRVEESYGDAKNLRMRHPMAALGFLFCVRSDIQRLEPDTAAWLTDLLGKLGQEDDAYHATCLLMIEYPDELVPIDGDADDENPLIAAGLEKDPEEDEDVPGVVSSPVEDAWTVRPVVKVLSGDTPVPLTPEMFLAQMVNRVLQATPVNRHVEARRRIREAPPVP